jgi:hypothetical protein
LLALATLAAGCGTHHSSLADANNNGTYVNAGPLTYQLQVSRQLNQFTPEDSGYLRGLPKADATLSSSQLWFGVFMWATNRGHRTATTTDNFDLMDTQGNVYKPIKLNPAANPYVWTPQPLAPGTTEPNPDTTAGTGPTGGDLLLFKLPSIGKNSIFDNRPLTLQIRSPSNNKVWATISLDL